MFSSYILIFTIYNIYNENFTAPSEAVPHLNTASPPSPPSPPPPHPNFFIQQKSSGRGERGEGPPQRDPINYICLCNCMRDSQTFL